MLCFELWFDELNVTLSLLRTRVGKPVVIAIVIDFWDGRLDHPKSDVSHDWQLLRELEFMNIVNLG